MFSPKLYENPSTSFERQEEWSKCRWSSDVTCSVLLCCCVSDTQSQGTSCGAVVLRSYVTVVCRSATHILQQAAGLIVNNCRLFESVSKIVANEITGLCWHPSTDLISCADLPTAFSTYTVSQMYTVVYIVRVIVPFSAATVICCISWKTVLWTAICELKCY